MLRRLVWTPLGILIASHAPLLAGNGEDQKFLGGDTAAGDWFGHEVAVSGDTAIVGAPFDEPSGSAYVFVRSGGTWVEQAKLTPLGAAADATAGWSVDVDGDTAVVGAGGDGPGAVYVFRRTAGTWAQVDRLTADDLVGFGVFGGSVAISGSLIAVGAPTSGTAGISEGSAYVFEEVPGAGDWVQVATLLPDDPVDQGRFGESIDVDGETVLVGSSMLLADLAGAAYVFERSGASFVQQAKLVAFDAATDDHFGWSVALDNDTAVVGAYGDDLPGTDSGAAYVFVRAGGGWSHQQKLLPVGAQSLDRWGTSVDVDGERVAIGGDKADGIAADTGASATFYRTGTSWIQDTQRWASDGQGAPGAGGDYFGAVALGPETLIAGAFRDDDNGADSGTAFFFTLPALVEPGNAFCAGDGSGSPCPCGNTSALLEGCAHSGGQGMRISGSGSTSIFLDNLTLTVTQAPPGNTGIFYSGRTSLAPGASLYDGLQCAGGDVRRYRGLFQTNGTVSDTDFVDQDPSGFYFQPGETYYFQMWSRDVAGGPSPCGTGANFSPGYAVTMSP